MTSHPDVEALSAHLDGLEPELAAHLEGCPVCRDAVAGLRAASAAVGAPVERVAPAVRDAAIGRALAAFGVPATASESQRASGGEAARPDAVVPLEPRRRARGRLWLTAGSAVAAALTLVAGSVTLLDRLGTEPGDVALSRDSAAELGAEAPTALDAGDLGAVAGLAELRQRVQASRSPARDQPSVVSGGSGGAGVPSASSGANSGAAATKEPSRAVGGSQSELAPPDAGPARPSDARSGTGPATVGTRPCEDQVRSTRSLGPLVYFADVTYQGEPAVVLGFPPLGAEAPVTLVVSRVPDCRVLGEVAAP